MELIVAMTYGQALFDAAKELDRIDEIREELDALDAIFKKEPDYPELLANPAVPLAEKKAMVRRVFEGRLSEEVLSFLYILLDKNRIVHFHRIVKSYLKLMDQYQGRAYGKIYSAVPLTEEQIAEFERQAEKLLRSKVELKNKVDESLLGGVKLLVDGKLIDASLRAGLSELRHNVQKL